jgi:hypothetical protein
MKQQNSFFEIGLAVFSGLTSFMFVYYAVGILNSVHVPEWDKVFGYVIIGYGLGNIYILSASWRLQSSWTLWANKLIALCFLGVFLMDMWKTGVKSPLEYVGALGMAGVLWLNWFAVKKLSQRGKDGGSPVDRVRTRPKKQKGNRR